MRVQTLLPLCSLRGQSLRVAVLTLVAGLPSIPCMAPALVWSDTLPMLTAMPTEGCLGDSNTQNGGGQVTECL